MLYHYERILAPFRFHPYKNRGHLEDHQSSTLKLNLSSCSKLGDLRRDKSIKLAGLCFRDRSIKFTNLDGGCQAQSVGRFPENNKNATTLPKGPEVSEKTEAKRKLPRPKMVHFDLGVPVLRKDGKKPVKWIPETDQIEAVQTSKFNGGPRDISWLKTIRSQTKRIRSWTRVNATGARGRPSCRRWKPHLLRKLKQKIRGKPTPTENNPFSSLIHRAAIKGMGQG